MQSDDDARAEHHGLKGPSEVIMIRHDRVCLHEAVKKLRTNSIIINSQD